MVHTAHNKQSVPGVCENDFRGTHQNRPNTISNDHVDFIKQHIASFPVVESHYCRKDSKRMYLSPDLSLPKMYTLY